MSMFPHSVTLIKKSNYSVSVVNGVYWYGNHSRRLNSKSMDNGNMITVVLPINKDVFNVGDILMKGEVNIPSAITSIADLEEYDYVTVADKEIHDVGSAIDNVVLHCQ